jgi:hypothetical protein
MDFSTATRGVKELNMNQLHERIEASVLGSHERAAYVTSGTLLQPGTLSTSGWTIIVTDARVICLKNDRQGRRQVEINRDSVVSAYQRSGLLSREVVIRSVAGKLRIAGMSKEAAAGLLAAVLTHQSSAVIRNGDTALDRVDLLEKRVEQLEEQVEFLEGLIAQRQ